MEYLKIINCINNELTLLETEVQGIFIDNKYFNRELYSFFENSKKIRSSLIFLILKALNINIDKKYFYLATSIELMHCASLIHDDIIDHAQNRRNNLSFNEKYGNSLSVILGDYLFAFSIDRLNKLNNNQIINLFSNTMKKMCEGEFEQYFTNGTIPTLKNYIEKSYNKTGILFETAITSALFGNKYKNLFGEFAKNFGIAFQIKDDYNNIYKNNLYNDIKEKIYTAPIIFACEDYPEIANLNEDKIIDIVQNEKYKKKTKNLITTYTKTAIEKIEFLQDNEYKLALKDLCKYIEKD